MRPLLLCLLGLSAVAADAAFAQTKLPSKTAPGAGEVRYFTAIVPTWCSRKHGKARP
jgi:hypothetical protein